jgi:hypothetical protein
VTAPSILIWARLIQNSDNEEFAIGMSTAILYWFFLQGVAQRRGAANETEKAKGEGQSPGWRQTTKGD